MSSRFFRRPLGVVAAVALSFWLLTSFPAIPFEGPTPQTRPALTQEPLNHGGNLVPAAVIPSNGVQASPIPTVFPDATLPKPGEPEQSLRLDSGQALQNALIHSSLGLKALQAGDRAKAQEELEASSNILSKIPEHAT